MESPGFLDLIVFSRCLGAAWEKFSPVECCRGIKIQNALILLLLSSKHKLHLMVTFNITNM